MTIDPVLFQQNLVLAVRAVAGATLYGLATVLIGILALKQLRADGGPFHPVLASVAGIALYSAFFTVVALAGVAHPMVVVGAVALPFAVGWRHLRPAWDGLVRAGRFRRSVGPLWLWPAVTLLYGAYVGLIAISNPLGGDLGNYHLIVPRDVLWNGAFVFNPFSHEAGIPYGWHLYGVPAFLIGGDRGYIVLSFISFALLLGLVWTAARRWRNETFAAAATAVTAFTICGMARGNIANNDIPTVLVESVALLLAVYRLPMPVLSQAVLFGLVSGLGLALKLQLAASAVILPLLFVFRVARRDWRVILTAAVAAVPFALVWPFVTFVNTGSPLPQVMMALRTQGPPPVYMREAMAVLNDGFGEWYTWNVSRVFSHGMEGYALLLAGVPFALMRRGTQGADRLSQLLVGYGIGRWLLLSAATQRLDILWHDRYHLASLLALGLAGLCGWQRVWSALATRLPRPVVAPAAAVLVWALVGWQFASHYEMRTPDPLSPGGVRSEVRPSMLNEMQAKARGFRQRPGTGPDGGLYDWIAEHLPPDAVVATTVIDPYYLQRRTIQLLPVSQDRVDLAGSPEAILAALRARGVTHLHLTQFSGLNAWMNPIIDQWLAGVRQIPSLPGVERLKAIMRSDKGEQAVYRIISRAGDDTLWSPANRMLHV